MVPYAFLLNVCESTAGFIAFLVICTGAFFAAYIAISAFFYVIWIVSVVLMRRVLSDVDDDDKSVPNVVTPRAMPAKKRRARSRSRSKK